MYITIRVPKNASLLSGYIYNDKCNRRMYENVAEGMWFA